LSGSRFKVSRFALFSIAIILCIAEYISLTLARRTAKAGGEAGKNPILSHTEAQRTQRKAKILIIIKKLCDLCVSNEVGVRKDVSHGSGEP